MKTTKLLKGNLMRLAPILKTEEDAFFWKKR